MAAPMVLDIFREEVPSMRAESVQNKPVLLS